MPCAARSTSRSAFAFGLALMLLLAHQPLPAASPHRADTSRQAREETIQSIPFDQLTEDVRGRIAGVMSSPTIYRRMPLQVIDCEPQMYLFLVRHPEVVVNIWELMGVTNVKLTRTGPYAFDAADGAGTTSAVHLVYGTKEMHILYAEGAYSGPLVKGEITGRCVLVLKSGYAERDDRSYVTNQLDVFVQLDNVGAELVMKTLHPLVGKSADHNFAESAEFLGRLSRAAEMNASGVQHLADRLTHVDPAVRQQFAAVAVRVNEQAALHGTRVAETDHALPAAAELPMASRDTVPPPERRGTLNLRR